VDVLDVINGFGFAGTVLLLWYIQWTWRRLKISGKAPSAKEKINANAKL
jgi:hypothetical protein